MRGKNSYSIPLVKNTNNGEKTKQEIFQENQLSSLVLPTIHPYHSSLFIFLEVKVKSYKYTNVEAQLCRIQNQ